MWVTLLVFHSARRHSRGSYHDIMKIHALFFGRVQAYATISGMDREPAFLKI